jgi:hypothetical protein
MRVFARFDTRKIFSDILVWPQKRNSPNQHGADWGCLVFPYLAAGRKTGLWRKTDYVISIVTRQAVVFGDVTASLVESLTQKYLCCHAKISVLPRKNICAATQKYLCCHAKISALPRKNICAATQKYLSG